MSDEKLPRSLLQGLFILGVLGIAAALIANCFL